MLFFLKTNESNPDPDCIAVRVLYSTSYHIHLGAFRNGGARVSRSLIKLDAGSSGPYTVRHATRTFFLYCLQLNVRSTCNFNAVI